MAMTPPNFPVKFPIKFPINTPAKPVPGVGPTVQAPDITQVHYAVTTCDTGSNQGKTRFCSDSKAEVVRKCLTSLFESIHYTADRVATSRHSVRIFDDHSTPETLAWLKQAAEYYTRGSVDITVESITTRGVMPGIRAGFTWLEKTGTDLVYWIPDDYMYVETGIYEMIDIFMQLRHDVAAESVVVGYNYPLHWLQPEVYRYKVAPRMIVPGTNRYWMQVYDTPSTFLTSKQQFSQHWDLYNKFFAMKGNDPRLEADTINHIFTRRGVLGIMPVDSVVFHMQAETERDPYKDWRPLWDSIPEIPSK
jgi:hypothetical protein